MAMMLTASLLAGKASADVVSDTENIRQENTGNSANTVNTVGVLTPEILWSMGRIGTVSVSPDGKRILYSVTRYDLPTEQKSVEFYLTDIKGKESVRLNGLTGKESAPVWYKNGTKIAYLSTESGSSQIWEMNPDGSDRRPLSQYDGDIEGFCFSPDEQKVLFIAQVKTVPTTAEKHPDLPKASGIIVDDLMYKHWDEWVTTAPHPFIASFDGEKIGEATDILEGEPYESPTKPFGGIEQLAWSPASDAVAYTCRKKTGLEYALSTNSDIYLYSVKDKTTRNLTEGMMGYDQNPKLSPDGKQIAWLSMERDGYESDLIRLFVMDLSTGEKRFVSRPFESNVEEYAWSDDGKQIYFSGVWHAEKHLYELRLKDLRLRQLTKGPYDYALVEPLSKQLIALRHSLSEPDEIYSVSLKEGEILPLTSQNGDVMNRLELGRVEERWLTTTDGKRMLTWVVYPPHFDASKKYPAVLYCQGGPQSAVSQFWSYRWNIQTLAAAGYIIVMPNRRGLPGFGREWNEEISGDYGGQCMKDYLTAIDSVAAESYVDADRLGCVGASFGGFSVYWLAGHHDGRFKAFISHDGLFNLDQQYLETEEMWFPNWDLGGPYWEKDNETVRRSYAQSPHLFVDKWDTPILCIHGEKDYRVLASQGMAAFNAARLRGLPAQLLIYPDENHWVLKPQNSVLWYRTFVSWLDRWLKK